LDVDKMENSKQNGDKRRHKSGDDSRHKLGEETDVVRSRRAQVISTSWRFLEGFCIFRQPLTYQTRSN
jgi:hypothetical protein